MKNLRLSTNLPFLCKLRKHCSYVFLGLMGRKHLAIIECSKAVEFYRFMMFMCRVHHSFIQIIFNICFKALLTDTHTKTQWLHNNLLYMKHQLKMYPMY
jgi:hypothetical protein